MKTSRYTDLQILLIFRQAEGGVPVLGLCREHGMSSATFYTWRAKFGGMDALMISQMKSIEDENRRLKKMFAELSIQNDLLKEALEKNRPAISASRARRACRRKTRSDSTVMRCNAGSRPKTRRTASFPTMGASPPIGGPSAMASASMAEPPIRARS